MSPKPLLAAVVVLVVGVVAWLLLPDYEPLAVAGEITNTIATPEPSPSPSVGTVVNDASATEATVRTAATPDKPPPRRGWGIGKPAEPPPSLPATLPVTVVDLRGEPVAGAAVSVFEQLAESRHAPGPPREQVITNLAGSVRVAMTGSCIVSAEHARAGWSGYMHVSPTSPLLRDGLRLVLLSMATVSGRVLLANGTAAAGATIKFVSGAAIDEPDTSPAPFAAGADGGFSVQVRAGINYYVSAQHRSQQMQQQRLPPLAAGEVRDITLAFPGAFSLRGVVRDSEQRPVRAFIQLARMDVVDLNGQHGGQCDSGGEFEVPLAHAGRYQVMAGMPGRSHTAALAEATVDAAEPHAEVTLTLQPHVVVEGKVVGERAERCAGVKVQLEPINQPTSDLLLMGMAMGLSYGSETVATDANGRFRFDAPVGRYRVAVQPVAENRWLQVSSDEFTAPVIGLTIAIGAAAQQGFELSGTVVTADGSAVTSEVRVGMCVPGDKSAAVGTGSDGTFRVGPFSVGHRYSFEVEAIGYAPTIVGPFDATVRCEQVNVQMQKWATVHCRVLRANGAPATHALVRLERDPAATFTSRTWQAETDADGRITFHNVVPATYRVLAKPTRQSPDAPAAEAVVLPGEDNDVQVVFGR